MQQALRPHVADTGQPWVRGRDGTNWFFAVVSVGANGALSPKILINSSPAVASFAAEVVRGTPPMAVTFTNQSQGSVTNWAWDFDSDGSIDSTEANPTMVYAQPGEEAIDTSPRPSPRSRRRGSGPDRQDTRVAVGFIAVFLPLLQGIRVLPDRTVEMELLAQAGRNYEIQASENLTGWTTLMSLTATNAVTTFRDSSAMGLNQRFYRAVVP
jgi:hypothetical protein